MSRRRRRGGIMGLRGDGDPLKSDAIILLGSGHGKQNRISCYNMLRLSYAPVQVMLECRIFLHLHHFVTVAGS